MGVPIAGRTHGKAVNITIPIEEGERYRMGTLKIVSADPDKALSLKVEALRSIFPLREGDILAVDKLHKSLKSYTDAYGQYGFIDFTAEPEFDINDDTKRITTTLKFDEQKPHYVPPTNSTATTTTPHKTIHP